MLFHSIIFQGQTTLTLFPRPELLGVGKVPGDVEDISLLGVGKVLGDVEDISLLGVGKVLGDLSSLFAIQGADVHTMHHGSMQLSGRRSAMYNEPCTMLHAPCNVWSAGLQFRFLTSSAAT